MDDDIVARMWAERLELQQKLKAVDQFLEAYGAPSSTGSKSAPRAPVRLARSFTDRIDKFGTYGKQVIEATLFLLPGIDGDPVPTRTLVEKLALRGIEIRGENKVNALSALLARSSKIKGHGRAGWTNAVEFEPLGADEAPNENEAPGSNPPEPQKSAEWGVQPPRSAWNNPQSGPAS